MAIDENNLTIFSARIEVVEVVCKVTFGKIVMQRFLGTEQTRNERYFPHKIRYVGTLVETSKWFHFVACDV